MKDNSNSGSGTVSVPGNELLLRKWEVAERLGVSVRTVDREASSGRLPKLKVRGCVCFRLADVLSLAGLNLQKIQS
jgi:excisionase family DNA binding protein